MARISIHIPEKFSYTTELQVRVNDLNYGNHLSNDKVLTIAHEARVCFLNELGYQNEMDINGVGMIVTDAAVVYKSESFLHDVLLIEIGFADISKVGLDLIYRISKKTNGQEVATVKTGIVFFDYDQRKIKPIPAEFLRKLNASRL